MKKAIIKMPTKSTPDGSLAFVELLVESEEQLREFDLPENIEITWLSVPPVAIQVGGNVIAMHKQ